MAIEAHATARDIRTSAQKAGLVLDLIRGKDVNRALATLQFAQKSVASDVAKLLRRVPLAGADVIGDGGLELDLHMLGRSRVHAKRVRERVVG